MKKVYIRFTILKRIVPDKTPLHQFRKNPIQKYFMREYEQIIWEMEYSKDATKENAILYVLNNLKNTYGKKVKRLEILEDLPDDNGVAQLLNSN